MRFCFRDSGMCDGGRDGKNIIADIESGKAHFAEYELTDD